VKPIGGNEARVVLVALCCILFSPWAFPMQNSGHVQISRIFGKLHFRLIIRLLVYSIKMSYRSFNLMG
jgi:hypothetical protein